MKKTHPSQHNSIPEFTKNEIQDAIDRLKKGKAKHSNGIRAEKLKNCSDDTKEKSGQSSKKLCSRGTSHQNVGERSVSRSSAKKVTERMQAITGQFAACQFSSSCSPQFLFARLAPSLHKIQPPDQAGFRPNHRCEDHLVVYRILEQRCREWSVPLYISTIASRKRFYRSQTSIREAASTALQPSGRHSFDRQRERRISDQKRDQTGDPLSSLLFNTVLQYSLENDLTRWQEKQKGIRLSDKTEDCLTNLRFADDVLLLSTSLERLREMLCEFKASTEAVGLGIHPDKTKILSNQDKVKVNEITVDNIKIEVLKKGDSARYLGQKITFEEQETEEIKNRLKAIWAAFHKYRQELTSRDYRLCHRLRLFSMVITPMLEYASGTWTVNSATRKDDQDCATKDAPSHRPNKKKNTDQEKDVSSKKEGS